MISKKPQLQIFNNRTSHASEIRNYLQGMPQQARIAASNNVGAHLSQREKIFVLPHGINDADYVIILHGDRYAKPSPEAQVKLAEQLRQNPNFHLDYQIGNFYSFKKSVTSD